MCHIDDRTAESASWSDEHFRMFFESAPDAHLVVDHQGRIVLVNSQAEQLFGYSRDEILQMPVLRLIPVRFRALVPVPGAKGWSRRHEHLQRQGMGIWGLHHDGTEFPAEISIQSIETERGLLYAATIRNTAGQVQAREQLLQHLSDLAHVSRISTMGEMVAGLTHELNQPLYAISNYARACQMLIQAHPAAPAELMTLTEKLLQQTERASEIVRRLRRFATRRAPRRSAVNINRLVQEVQQLMLFHAHRFSIATRMELADGLPSVSGDSILLEQVIANLVRNAFEAVSEAGTSTPVVTIQTRQVDETMIQVTVRDNGPGFDHITQEQLFEAFFTTREQGMGLGLVICQSIVEAHGGRLTASANPAGGAEFQLTLPVDRESYAQ